MSCVEGGFLNKILKRSLSHTVVEQVSLDYYYESLVWGVHILGNWIFRLNED